MCIRQFNSAWLACLAALLLSAASSDSKGDVLSGAFSATPIPDGVPAGIVLDFAPAPGIAAVNQITLNISHEWLGDLTVRLIPPSGPGFVLFQRPGVSPASPEGSMAVLGSFTPATGTVFQLSPATYTFARTGLDLATAANNAVTSQPDSTLPPGQVYAGQFWEAGPFPAGQWQLLVSDSAVLSTGLVTSAEIDYAPTGVPEPSPLTLVAVGAALLAGLRSFRPGR